MTALGLVGMPAELAWCEPIVRRCVRSVCRWARHADPEELAQEARLKLWLHSDALAQAMDDGHRDNLAAKIARSAMFDALRTKGYRFEPWLVHEDDCAEEPADPISPEDHLQAAQLHAVVSATAAGMPERLRDLWGLVSSGISGEDIAKRWSLSAGRISQLRSEMLSRIRRAVRAQGYQA